MRLAWLTAATLWRRELTRFARDRARVIGALAPPIVFWFLIGSGLGDAVRVPGAAGGLTYLQYFYAGTLELIVLFTSVFSTISIIEDRREGFLQAVLVAPAPRLAVAAGKVLGAATVGLLQGLSFLVFAPAAGLHPGAEGWALAALALTLSSIGLTGLGFCIAWLLDSTQGFHAVMNLFLIPMWMLSGALFPAAGAPGWLKTVIALNPVSYGVSALQRALLPAHAAASGAAAAPLSLAVLAAFAAAALAAAGAVASRRD
ncbi:MAG: ABC transporter permease [Elusimicrobia bacterium]|nr:ABC transporter permease [Elusimicrobiota bacterium]